MTTVMLLVVFEIAGSKKKAMILFTVVFKIDDDGTCVTAADSVVVVHRKYSGSLSWDASSAVPFANGSNDDGSVVEEMITGAAATIVENTTNPTTNSGIKKTVFALGLLMIEDVEGN